MRVRVLELAEMSENVVLVSLLPVSIQPMHVCHIEDGEQPKGWEPNAEEKALLREEFISQMHQRFLDGKDKDFNYRSVKVIATLRIYILIYK